MSLVFQDGSNTSTARLNSPERLDGAATVVGLARTVGCYKLRFNVWSKTNNCAAASIDPGGDRPVWGLYDVPDDLIRRETAGKKRSLDAIEGEGSNYRREAIEVIVPGSSRPETAITYVALTGRDGIQTSVEYARSIIGGLREHGAPTNYIDGVVTAIRVNSPYIGEDDLREQSC